MKHPQIVVFESDGTLANYLQPLAQERRWLLRESRQGPACIELLRGGPAVLVLKIGRHLVRELTFLDEAHAKTPDVPIIAVGDAADATLFGLTMELGASYVLFPPQPRQQLAEVVQSLMELTLRRLGADAPPIEWPPPGPVPDDEPA
jgi:DNA-binding NtrC family response regulator